MQYTKKACKNVLRQLFDTWPLNRPFNLPNNKPVFPIFSLPDCLLYLKENLFHQPGKGENKEEEEDNFLLLLPSHLPPEGAFPSCTILFPPADMRLTAVAASAEPTCQHLGLSLSHDGAPRFSRDCSVTVPASGALTVAYPLRWERLRLEPAGAGAQPCEKKEMKEIRLSERETRIEFGNGEDGFCGAEISVSEAAFIVDFEEIRINGKYFSFFLLLLSCMSSHGEITC